MSRTVRVGMHHFRTYEGHRGRDGANFAYEEIHELLVESSRIIVVPHDIHELFADDVAARRALGACDTVVAAVGPHAYIYFYLRERLNLQFRIIRDVRTALWNAYVLQEALVAPYVRPEDAVIHSTAYSRDVFSAILPSIPVTSMHICYPLMRWFPSSSPSRRRDVRHRDDPMVIGYVGRLTDDKNFPQVLDLIAALERRRPGRFHLRAVGDSATGGGLRVARARLGVAARAYTWVPSVARADVWRHYAEFDVLFFPSTSTLETFGRVLVEAMHAGVPVLASAHGPTTELLATDAIVPTAYDAETVFNLHSAAPLGVIDVSEAVERLIDGPPVPVSHGHRVYAGDPGRFVDIVVARDGYDCDQRDRFGTPQQAAFIARLDIHNLAAATSVAEADAAIALLRRRFVVLHQRGPAYALALLDLLFRSSERGKTVNFIRQSVFRGEDFTNIGGMDLQFSHLLGFRPTFRLAASAALDGEAEQRGRGELAC